MPTQVSPKVLGGADLFLQGVIVPPSGLVPFSEGDVRAVGIPGSRFPFAVGTMQTDSGAAARSGMKGKGVKLLHHFGDQLYLMGDKSRPDPGFTLERIFPQACARGEVGKMDARQTGGGGEGGAGRALVAGCNGAPVGICAVGWGVECACKVMLRSVLGSSHAPAIAEPVHETRRVLTWVG